MPTLSVVSHTDSQTDVVDGIPVLTVPPPRSSDRRQVALFLPYLGATKESVAPQLEALARQGFTALSLDPWRFGQRGTGDDAETARQTLSGFREHMWPILGQTTLDSLHVLDWALRRYSLDPERVVAGGISMGGDIALALAGIDPRVKRVAAVVATPDWTRPGMTQVDDPTRVIDQGTPTTYGGWLRHQLDPSLHPERYTTGPAIAFELGAIDTHVPPDAAGAFRDAILAANPHAEPQVRITLHPGLDHVGAIRAMPPTHRAVEWLTFRKPRP